MDNIELIDESGQVIEVELIDTFGLDDDDYAVFSTLDDTDLLYILKIEVSEDDEEVYFVGVEDDELDELIEVYEELKEEQDS